MNNERRKRIELTKAMVQAAFDKLEEARTILDDIQAEEQDAFDAMPEGFQTGERGERAQEAIDGLSTAVEEIDALDFESIFNSLNQAAA